MSGNQAYPHFTYVPLATPTKILLKSNKWISGKKRDEGRRLCKFLKMKKARFRKEKRYDGFLLTS